MKEILAVNVLQSKYLEKRHLKGQDPLRGALKGVVPGNPDFFGP
jgi:hypothetical protein